MFHLLNEYAKLLKFKPTMPEKAVELYFRNDGPRHVFNVNDVIWTVRAMSITQLSSNDAAGGETPPPPQQPFPSAAALSFIFHQQEHDPASVHRHLCRNGSHHDPEVCWYCLYGVYVQRL